MCVPLPLSNERPLTDCRGQAMRTTVAQIYVARLAPTTALALITSTNAGVAGAVQWCVICLVEYAQASEAEYEYQRIIKKSETEICSAPGCMLHEPLFRHHARHAATTPC